VKETEVDGLLKVPKFPRVKMYDIDEYDKPLVIFTLSAGQVEDT
jgi:hypothetical protein